MQVERANKDCKNCVKRKTLYCPNSSECFDTLDMPYYQNRIMLLEENEKLKMINKEYERLNKEKYRGFKIIDVQEYDRYELLSYKNYKDNWNKLKQYCEEATFYYTTGNGKYKTEMMGNARNGIDILNKMQELEQGSDSKW